MSDPDIAHVKFTVGEDETGRITTDLTVDYNGPGLEPIREFISEFEQQRKEEVEAASESFEKLILDLPMETPVTEVELHKGTSNER